MMLPLIIDVQVVQRELHRLERAGLVSVRMHGNQKHYQANPASPLHDEICSIVQKTVALQPCIQLRSSIGDALEAIHSSSGCWTGR